mmetsp:Transcript_28301/g.91633  ORF Transcript_28301/g.91633 Transcript_28301/m.91633 type:complete len:289 (-) Transcript_28301:1108-1974(-)
MSHLLCVRAALVGDHQLRGAAPLAPAQLIVRARAECIGAAGVQVHHRVVVGAAQGAGLSHGAPAAQVRGRHQLARSVTQLHLQLTVLHGQVVAHRDAPAQADGGGGAAVHHGCVRRVGWGSDGQGGAVQSDKPTLGASHHGQLLTALVRQHRHQRGGARPVGPVLLAAWPQRTHAEHVGPHGLQRAEHHLGALHDAFRVLRTAHMHHRPVRLGNERCEHARVVLRMLARLPLLPLPRLTAAGLCRRRRPPPAVGFRRGRALRKPRATLARARSGHGGGGAGGDSSHAG